MSTQALTCNKNPIEFLPSKRFLSSRRLRDVFAIHLPKTSSRRVYKTSCNYVFKTSSRRLGRQKNVALKTPSRRLQDVFSTSSARRMFAGMKNAFYFMLKALFVLEVFRFLYRIFGFVEKRLDKKAMANF